MAGNVPISRLLEEASERLVHHWLDLETFHATMMRHTTKQSFRTIKIFVSQTLMDQLKELWVNGDDRVSEVQEQKGLDGYAYSYRLMPILSDIDMPAGYQYIPQDKFIVAYYGEIMEKPAVMPMAYRQPLQADLDLSLEDELDQLAAATAVFPQAVERARKYDNPVDAYYNAPTPQRAEYAPDAGSYYANPKPSDNRFGEATGDWDPADYGGPGNA